MAADTAKPGWPSVWSISSSPTEALKKNAGLLLVLGIALSTLALVSSEQQEIYGTQCSFSITDGNLNGCDPEMLNQRQKFYNQYMDGCFRENDEQECLAEERIRWQMNQRQPQSMVNMTSTGYMKLKAPPKLLKLLTIFWESHKHKKQIEDWGGTSIYTNHWDCPTYMVDVHDTSIGGGDRLQQMVWDAAIDGIAQWTGGVAKLRPVSLYGIREYTEGAVLSPHVDRIPLVSSGIVNVAQDVDEPWPLEVYDRNGHAVNITMEPGDMVLYESHSLIHGRPFPLKGRFFANIFIHFEPFDGWDAARDKTHLGDNSGDLPPYILPGSPAEQDFRFENPNGWSKFFAEGEEPPVGNWAGTGELDKLKEIAELDTRLLKYQDENGWAPIHEAARNGQLQVVKYLINTVGVDMNAMTKSGSTPLRIAIDEDDPGNKRTIFYLKKLGAKDSGASNFYDHPEDEEDDDDDDDDHEEDDNDNQDLKDALSLVEEIEEIGEAIVHNLEDDEEEL